MVAYIILVILGIYFQYSIGTPTSDADDIAQQMSILRRQFEHLNQDLIQVNQKLDSTSEQNVNLMKKMNALEKDNTKLRLVVHSTSKTNSELLDRVHALEEENYVIKKTVYNFRHPDWNFDTLNGKAKTPTKEVFLQQENDTPLTNNYIEFDFNTNILSTVTTSIPTISKVAFSVALTGGLVLLGTHQVIEYNKVYTNIGNSYDVRHGHFIVPSTGMFLLSFTVMTATDIQAYIQMVKNGVEISSVYCSSNRNDMDSQTTVHLLQKGDVVWIRHADGGTPTLNGNDPYNTFTGVLLYDV
ncbi:C1QL [Mytilus edulis]|uniref:C1QL n=1 Tax=Mytilus edulis TaxID=6550 RepID=A0A8S3T5Z5_MYTED|nr:C1QL [Mytilus edulis]